MCMCVPDRDPRSPARRKPGPSVALRALTSGALALPGMAGKALGDSPITDWTSDFNYSRYSEDSVSGNVIEGSSERYDIDMYQFNISAPWGPTRDVSIDVLHETMSGASPWFIVEGDDGVGLVMSGATIEDARTDVSVTTNFYHELGKNFISLGGSGEDDYLSFNVGLGGERHFNEKLTTLSGGIAASVDEIDPEGDEEDPLRIDGKEYKHSYTGMAGVSRVLDRNTVVQTSLTYQHQRGFLDDPYKRVLVANSIEQDSRPGGRHQVSWLTRLRRHSPRFYGTMHLDYRFYADSWDITSHTFELAWYQDVFGWFQLVPSARYYSQSEADFYDLTFAERPSVSHFSSDYRLSNYAALAFRAKLETRELSYRRVTLSALASYERYISGDSFALTSSDKEENPALLDYNLFTVGLTARW